MKISWQYGGHDNCPDGPRNMIYEYVQGFLYIKSEYFLHVQYASLGAEVAQCVW